jgi:peptidoglycan/xylan/chitin deacetylase (PgdA/CDA1 family)
VRNSRILIKKECNDILVSGVVRSIILTFFLLIAMNMFLEEASAFIYTNATNNADTFIMQDKANENFGSSDSLGIYDIGNRMITLMNWTLPDGSGNIKEITLNMYCKKWDSFPATPVKLNVLKKGFNESEATWNNKPSSINWIGQETMMSDQAVDSVLIDKEGIYSWVIKGNRAEKSFDSLTWGNSINISLSLPGKNNWQGVQCYSKETAQSRYRPYLIVTDESSSNPGIFDAESEPKKTNALIISKSDLTSYSRINYGTNKSNLDKWSEYEIPGTWHYNILSSLDPGTIYYYKIYVYNYIDLNNFSESPLFSFSTKEETSIKIPLVTFVFDDGFKSTYTRAFPILNNSLFPGVTAVISLNAIEGYANYMNITELQTLQENKWEIASHSVTHPDLQLINDTQLDHELLDSKNTLWSNGFNVYNFVSPYGSYNSHTQAHIMKYYDSDRSTQIKEIPPGNEYPLPGTNIWNTTTPDEVKKWVDNAINNNSWLILVFHNIADHPGDDTPMWTEGEWKTDELAEIVRFIESKESLQVVTIREGLAMSFKNKGIYASTTTKTLTNKIYSNGSINYSKTVTGHPEVNMMVQPSFGQINVTILDWSSYYKRWNESGSTSSYHIIGDFPIDTSVRIKINGTIWKEFITNSSGYIAFNYDEGYNDQEFEAITPQLKPPLSQISQSNQTPQMTQSQPTSSEALLQLTSILKGPSLMIVIGVVLFFLSGLYLIMSNKK